MPSRLMKEKEQYLTPESEALEMRLEGVIVSSADPLWNPPFNPEEEW